MWSRLASHFFFFILPGHETFLISGRLAGYPILLARTMPKEKVPSADPLSGMAH